MAARDAVVEDSAAPMAEENNHPSSRARPSPHIPPSLNPHLLPLSGIPPSRSDSLTLPPELQKPCDENIYQLLTALPIEIEFHSLIMRLLGGLSSCSLSSLIHENSHQEINDIKSTMVSLRKRKRMRLFSGESNALVPLPSFWDKEISRQDPNRMPSNDVIQPERMRETKKPRIKTFAKKSPTKKKKDYLQYRCNMMGFADAMQLYKPTIQQRQDICDELAKTPFWSLLKVYMDDILITTDRKKKSGMDLIKIMQCYNSKEQKIKFGDNEAKGITNDDVVQIFGLNNRGVELPNTDKSTKHGKEDPFVDKYFKHAKVVKRKQLIEAYEKSLLDQSPQGAKDTTSIICAHLIQSLLFANSGTYITWSFLKICGELDEINKYNWAKGVKDYLLKMINKAQKKKKDRGEEPTISGCTVFVLYWICLHTNVVKTVKGRENMIPAIARWDTSMIHKAIKDVPVEQIKVMTNNQVISLYISVNNDYLQFTISQIFHVYASRNSAFLEIVISAFL
ncbi:hypothetical protein FF1_035448 [Malus domestica]